MSYKWDNKKPTAQMLGRWQPFHKGHYTLFKETLTKDIIQDIPITFILHLDIFLAKILNMHSN